MTLMGEVEKRNVLLKVQLIFTVETWACLCELEELEDIQMKDI